MTEFDEALIALAAVVLEIDCRSEERGSELCSLVIRRQGERLAAFGGAAAMRTALADVLALSPANADRRRTIIMTAWSGLPAWGK